MSIKSIAGAEPAAGGAARNNLRLAQDRLHEWLLVDAMPLWSTCGVDAMHGGFEERLSLEGTPTHEARRARVQPRQLFACAGAQQLGWRGGADQLIRHGLNYFMRHFRRPDGLYRALVAPDGTVLDDSVHLYDQAFALLGFAAAQRVCGTSMDCERPARELLTTIASTLRHEAGGYASGLPGRIPLQSNPHMHLLEACLEWQQLSDAGCWRELSEEITELALGRFIDSNGGMVREVFSGDWQPMTSLPGRVIEPGHQFEWAWLLLRATGDRKADARRNALRLIELGEQRGVHQGVALDGLLDNGYVYRATARLWPQSERLRALSYAAALTGEERYWSGALEAARGLLRYLNAAVPGLWHDELLADGRFRIGPAPAGNLYHIVGAILAVEEALAIGEPRA